MLHNKTGKYRGVSLKEEHSISDTTLLGVMNILIKEFFDLEFSALWGASQDPMKSHIQFWVHVHFSWDHILALVKFWKHLMAKKVKNRHTEFPY